MKVLVTGGAGYIGSHTVVALTEAGHEVLIVDNFSNSSTHVVDHITALVKTPPSLRHVDLRDSSALGEAFSSFHPDAVIHFAGLKSVGESVSNPLRYYTHNIAATTTLLEVMREFDVHKLIFSSSATVYGSEAPLPYTEKFEPLNATNPYGQSKVVLERILEDIAKSDLRWRIGVLRYFNPVGAHPSGIIGEDPSDVPTNLMPYISQVAVGRHERLIVFGNDYPTKDGTGERDYIHVQDVARGHLAALNSLVHERSHGWRAWNLGTGSAHSVMEVVKAFEEAAGVSIPFAIAPRRPGDLPAVWADESRARSELAWVAQHNLHEMVRDAWNWQRKNPEGYGAEPRLQAEKMPLA